MAHATVLTLRVVMRLLLDTLLFLFVSGAARFVASGGDGRSWSVLDAAIAMLAIHLFFPTLTIVTLLVRTAFLLALMRGRRWNRSTYALVSYATMALSLTGTGFFRWHIAFLAQFAVAALFAAILARISPLPFARKPRGLTTPGSN